MLFGIIKQCQQVKKMADGLLAIFIIDSGKKHLKKQTFLPGFNCLQKTEILNLLTLYYKDKKSFFILPIRVVLWFLPSGFYHPAALPAAKGTTIAWNIRHITRIEDIAANILIANGKQILNNTWLKKLGVTVRDTGNAMSRDKILDLSNSLNMVYNHFQERITFTLRRINANLHIENDSKFRLFGAYTDLLCEVFPKKLKSRRLTGRI